ncbi:2-polyprenyl-3-methyl-5-hydroxy-6-metoxy-1,4-benzoquinol methylase [Bacillus mesophilus]|uniref:Class I SAM-dependent methyltransferase n=1 Tax=Bacillus mesophilus TaxID=1808955 RepID=A0A6M0QED3_9BACI|nr:class I SAM-dependent methyltransferase [Bacillus mesophilus]MBM7663275.1 2-polyprenyl-3-methyl-5-hydroxy-6-metoxy-1,4-benzoquinol methylase [Bacillus mesophilus]NEY74060.1 class I SAM-dependent methyltransferase [Bacillus mesophilus]
MLAEWYETLKARKWMKKNVPFLYSWHAYVGNECKLFLAFKKPQTVSEVATTHGLPEDLLQSWVEIGVAIRHLKKTSSNSYQVKRLKLFPNKGSLSGALLKEMMELHIPSLLAYPDLMTAKDKLTFDHDKHGDTVAKTSRLIETIAFPNYKKIIKEKDVSSILDIGCGYGGYLQRIARHKDDVHMHGLDFNPQVVKQAEKACKEYSNIEIFRADVNEWEPTNQKYDLIMLNNVMHYISPSKRSKLLLRVSKWLKKEGHIVIITPFKYSRHGKEFSAAFNSFFHAQSNLYSLPSEAEVKKIVKQIRMEIKELKPIIKEGSWYITVLEQR